MANVMELAAKLGDRPGRVVFDSSSRGDLQATTSFLSANPEHVFKARVDARDNCLVDFDGQVSAHIDPLQLLEEKLKAFSMACDSRMPVAFGVLSYDFGQWLYGLPTKATELPSLWVGFYPWCFEVNTETQALKIHGKSKTDRAAAQEVWGSLGKIGKAPEFFQLKPSDLKHERYRAGFDKIKDYLEEGDCYQANLSLLLEAKLKTQGDPLRVFEVLKSHASSSYSALLQMEGLTLLSASPERLFKYDARRRHIETRPIKGTRELVGDESIDRARGVELSRDSKELAEHLMIVDLERNDLGKIAEVGSVHVKDYAKATRFTSVMHLVSSIEATVKENVGTAEIIKAMFPGGSITGAPKKRSMEIISECEEVNRGLYCGSGIVFYSDGSMDASILIRSAELSKIRLSLRMGGGIVYDSNVERELKEINEKSRSWRDLLANL